MDLQVQACIICHYLGYGIEWTNSYMRIFESLSIYPLCCHMCKNSHSMEFCSIYESISINVGFYYY
jgi:hypothetical protein